VRGSRKTPPGLDLDEDQRPAIRRDKINLTGACPQPARQQRKPTPPHQLRHLILGVPSDPLGPAPPGGVKRKPINNK
jgi:hypothetical protein